MRMILFGGRPRNRESTVKVCIVCLRRFKLSDRPESTTSKPKKVKKEGVPVPLIFRCQLATPRLSVLWHEQDSLVNLLP